MTRTHLISPTLAATFAASSLVNARQTASPQAPVPGTPAATPAPPGGRGGGHVWPLWRQNLTDMVPRLFQPKS